MTGQLFDLALLPAMSVSLQSRLYWVASQGGCAIDLGHSASVKGLCIFMLDPDTIVEAGEWFFIAV